MSLVAPLTLAAGFLAGCSVSTTDNSITFKTQTKYTGDAVNLTATKDFADENIVIDNGNGDVVVNGDPSATKISVSTKPFAFADGKDDKAGTTGEPDAQAAIKQVVATIVIDESTAGTVTVKCAQASNKVGSAATGTTGCDNFTVTVPSSKGVKLSAVAHNGSNTASGLTAADGAQVMIGSGNGDVTATITGGANVKSDNGQVVANITPTKGAQIEVTTGNGDIDLSLPTTFAADSVALSAGGGDASKVVIDSAFTGLTAGSTSYGKAGTGAASLKATASDLGTLTIKPL